MFKKLRLLTRPTLTIISPSRPESAKTDSSPRDASCPKQGLSNSLYLSLGEWPRLPFTARIERAQFHRARSASKKGTWPLPPLLANFFSILLLRKRELGQLSLLEPLLHQRANIEHPFDLLNVVESGFRAGVRRGEE